MIIRLEFAAADVVGHVELEIPSTGRARYELVVSGAAVGPGFVVVRDPDLAPPRGRVLELRGDGIWTELTEETVDEHWSFGLEAFGLRVDDPAEEIGERIAVGYDLEWEAVDRVQGDLLLGRETVAIDARGHLTRRR